MTATTNGARSRLPIRLVILFAGIATIFMVWLYRDALHGWVLVRGTLANDAPPLELFEEYLRRSPEPEKAMLEAWNTGKIVHRQFAIRQLSAGDVNGKSLSLELEGMLLSGALDPDMNVRESALQGPSRLGTGPGMVIASFFRLPCRSTRGTAACLVQPATSPSG